MTRIRTLAFVLLALLIGAYSQAQTVTVTAAHLGGSNPITGTITFQPALSDGTQASAHISSGGISARQSVTVPVTAGAFSLPLPDTNLTQPQNLCYSVTAHDIQGRQILGPGFSCVQPAANNTWCTAGVCNFDGYVPFIPTLPVQYQPAVPITTAPAAPPVVVGTTAGTVAAGDDSRIVNAAEVVLPGSPTAVWKLDETAGTTLHDTSGNGNDIALNTAATINGQGVTFTAAGQQLVTPVTSTYQTAMVVFTHNPGPMYVTNPTTDESAIFEAVPVFLGTTATSPGWLSGFDGSHRPDHQSVPVGYLNPSVVDGTAADFLASTAAPVNGGAHVLVHVRDATSDRLYLDGVLQANAYTGGSAGLTMVGNTVLGGIASGGTLSTAGWFWGTFHSVVLWPSQLTPAQVAEATQWAGYQVQARGLTAPGAAPARLTDGVSRLSIVSMSIGACAADSPAACWNNNLTLHDPSLQANIVRSALGGTSTEFMLSSAPYRHEPLTAANAALNIVVLWDGINAGCRVGDTVAQQWAEDVAFAQREHALGFKVIIGTMIDDGGTPTTKSGLCGGALTPAQYKAAYNATVRAHWTEFFDNIGDIALDPLFGPDGSSASSTYYYSDHVHLLDAAQPSLAADWSTAINAVIDNTVTGTTAAASGPAAGTYIGCVTSVTCGVNTTTPNNLPGAGVVGGTNFMVQAGKTAQTGQARVILTTAFGDAYGSGQSEFQMGVESAPSGLRHVGWILAQTGVYYLRRFTDNYGGSSDYLGCDNNGCNFSAGGQSSLIINGTDAGGAPHAYRVTIVSGAISLVPLN